MIELVDHYAEPVNPQVSSGVHIEEFSGAGPVLEVVAEPFDFEDYVRNFGVDVLDLINDLEHVANELECDNCPTDMLFKARELRRENDRQRKAIALLKRGGAVLPPPTNNNPAWG